MPAEYKAYIFLIKERFLFTAGAARNFQYTVYITSPAELLLKWLFVSWTRSERPCNQVQWATPVV